MNPRIKLSRQSVGPGSSRPKTFKTQPSAVKVMATVFWDAQGVIMLDFLAKKSTIKLHIMQICSTENCDP